MQLKKANTIMKLYGFMFMIIGLTFIGKLIVAGYFNKIGISSTAPNSHGINVAFLIVGITFLVMGAIFLSIEFYKQKEREKLRITGIKIQGTVTKIKKISHIRVGKKLKGLEGSPYIIYFFYEYSGRKYHGKSQLIWNNPIISGGDIITVWIDEYKKQHYFVDCSILLK